jgi:hypothetical protein
MTPGSSAANPRAGARDLANRGKVGMKLLDARCLNCSGQLVTLEQFFEPESFFWCSSLCRSEHLERERARQGRSEAA